MEPSEELHFHLQKMQRVFHKRRPIQLVGISLVLYRNLPILGRCLEIHALPPHMRHTQVSPRALDCLCLTFITAKAWSSDASLGAPSAPPYSRVRDSLEACSIILRGQWTFFSEGHNMSTRSTTCRAREIHTVTYRLVYLSCELSVLSAIELSFAAHASALFDVAMELIN